MSGSKGSPPPTVSEVMISEELSVENFDSSGSVDTGKFDICVLSAGHDTVQSVLDDLVDIPFSPLEIYRIDAEHLRQRRG